MAKILGIGGLDHNGAICIVEDGEVKSFVELERITRVKNLGFENSKQIEPVLGIMAKYQFDIIAVGDVHWWGKKKFWLEPLLEKYMPNSQIVIHNHHLCHLSAAFYLSPFEEAITIAIDGKGDGLSTSWALGARGTPIQIAGSQSSWYSLGRLWWAISESCGFPSHYSAGKTMAFGSLGSPNGFLVNCIQWDGLKFIFEHEGMQDEDWRDVKRIKSWCDDLITSSVFQTASDLAADLQELTVHIATKMTHLLIQEYDCANICVVGGVALNGLMNQAIIEMEDVNQVFIPPVTDDRGLAMGAALQSAALIGDQPQSKPRCSPYLGPIEPPGEMVDSFGYKCVATGSQAESCLVELLTKGALVAWHQGRSEAGPRALCHRSLLATPTDKKLSERINSEVKLREWFRPFGCSIISEDAGDWLMMEGDSPYMLRIVAVLENMRGEVPGVVHLDGTTRPHLVHRDVLPELHSVLSELKVQGHPPLVLNTSLNRRGEPLSETVSDTFAIAKAMKLDGIYLNGDIWVKDE